MSYKRHINSIPQGYDLCKHEDLMVSEYQRRTLTGTGRQTKTARSCTGKTPRTIASAQAETSASIMVRFFCIFSLNGL